LQGAIFHNAVFGRGFRRLLPAKPGQARNVKVAATRVIERRHHQELINEESIIEISGSEFSSIHTCFAL
jgi:hypothetical protein